MITINRHKFGSKPESRVNQISTAERDAAIGMAKLVPIGRETVQDRVYAALRRALICGLFEPGQVLTIQGLAASFATSTMPVREALGRLISEKALEAMPNRSVRVPPVTAARLEDLLRIRLMIEGEAVALAALRLTQGDIARLKDWLAEWQELRHAGRDLDFTRALDLNQAFHFLIYRAAGSQVLIPIIESLWLQSGPCTRAATTAFADAGKTDLARFHENMVEAFEARDASAARQALEADIRRPFDLLHPAAAQP
jgi:DNA-binding GntR family transcriptional regulator